MNAENLVHRHCADRLDFHVVQTICLSVHRPKNGYCLCPDGCCYQDGRYAYYLGD